MSFSKDRKTGFSNGGFRGRRVNPDGSYPSVDNHLGFVGTVDLSAISASAVLSYRWDGIGAFTDITIDLSAAGVTPSATTVAEVVTALNLVAGFSAQFLASTDTDTSRLKIENAVAVTGKTYLELKGAVAIALGFGESGDASAMGTAFVECYTRAGAFTFAKNVRDSEEVEQENSRGSYDTMMIDAVHRGINPTIAVNEELYELKQMLQGGSWDDTLAVYTPPTSDLAIAPLCAFEFYIPKYDAGTSHRSQLTGYKMYDVSRLTGRETDVSADVKSWASYQFETMATEYTIDGVRYPAYLEKEITIATATTMGIM